MSAIFPTDNTCSLNRRDLKGNETGLIIQMIVDVPNYFTKTTYKRIYSRVLCSFTWSTNPTELKGTYFRFNIYEFM